MQPKLTLKDLLPHLSADYRKKVQIMLSEEEGEADLLKHAWDKRPEWPEYPSVYDGELMRFLRAATPVQVFAAGLEIYVDQFERFIEGDEPEVPMRFDLTAMKLVPIP